MDKFDAIFASLMVALMGGLVALLIWTVNDTNRQDKLDCASNAKLVTNATDHYYDGNSCFVVVDGKAKEIK